MKDICKLKWTVLQASIFSLLCLKVGQKLGVREISRLLGVSPTAVSKSLLLFEKNNIIIKDEKNRNFLIELNINDKNIINLKRVENLRCIYQSGLASFLIDKFPESNIFLFGSYSFGQDSVLSDIDFAIIGSKEKTADLVKYEKLFERKIYIHFFKNFKDINKNLKENIFNGILLNGGVEL